MTHAGEDAGRTWCMSEVDIFRDLSEREMDAIAAAAPMKTYSAGELLYSPSQPSEVLFILKKGRVRIFRVSADGRALTCAIITPGTILGEMVLLGQRMYDNFAEALGDVTVCVMSRADVHRFLLADARISARITEILGRRLPTSNSACPTASSSPYRSGSPPPCWPSPPRPGPGCSAPAPRRSP